MSLVDPSGLCSDYDYTDTVTLPDDSTTTAIHVDVGPCASNLSLSSIFCFLGFGGCGGSNQTQSYPTATPPANTNGNSGGNTSTSVVATLTNVAKKIGNYIPVVCGGGVFNYLGGQGGALVSVGVSEIHQADFSLAANQTTSTYSEGAFAEVSAGEGLLGGYGQATMTNGSKENFFFGGVGEKILAVNASASLFVAGSSPGINLEGSLFNIKGGVGVYLNVSSATSCYGIK